MWGDTSSIVEKAAVCALREMGSSQEKKAKGSEIYAKICAMQQDYKDNLTESVFKSYLSGLSRKPDSQIAKDPGSHGYYLKEILDDATEMVAKEDSEFVTEEKKRERKENEKLLYPILENWLQAQGYRTKDTSQMKGMGRWGNPDITGISADESLGSFDIEIVTIEAKITHHNYRYDFFEAVSHKRFANRVYFGFASTSNFLREYNEELRYYSELYGVGVVAIAIDEQYFKQYIDGKLKVIDNDRVDVYEVYSANFEARLRRWQKSFLEQLGITSTRELWGWGSAL